MFNSPILDITIGLVFIFLLYSLLATSINEAIATLFALRARMLRSAIVEHMLSNTPTYSRLNSLWKGIFDFLMAIPRIFIGPEKGKGKIGDHFFDHPIIKHYGSTRVFAIPSYLSAGNFSTIIIDVLKKDFQKNLELMSEQLKPQLSKELSTDTLMQNMQNGQDIDKIRQLLDYYKQIHKKPTLEAPNTKSIATRDDLFIDQEVWDVLDMFLKKSNFDLSEFQKQLETWYDDTMDRVSGWYKRQTQCVLFCLGLFMAILFNLDTIGISTKLSTNTDARKIIVAQAISFAEEHKTDPELQPKNPPAIPAPIDTGIVTKGAIKKVSVIENKDSIIHDLQKKLEDISDFKKKEIDTINTLLALGWGDYGIGQNSDEKFNKYFTKDSIQRCTANLPPTNRNSTPEQKLKWLTAYYEQHSWLKFKYVCSEFFGWRKFIGFLITAFAISLGAPFWFDMLNKVIKLRGTGTKEDGNAKGKTVASVGGNSAPIIINNHLTEEAQG